MEFDESFGEREPDSKSPFRMISARCHLREHFQYACDRLRGKTDSVVHNAYSDAFIATRGAQSDYALWIRVLRCIRQEIRKNLCQA